MYTVEIRVHDEYWHSVEVPHQTFRHIANIIECLNASGAEYELHIKAEPGTVEAPVEEAPDGAEG